MEILLGLVGLALLIVYLITPLIVFSLLSRVGRLEEELRNLRAQQKWREQNAASSAPIHEPLKPYAAPPPKPVSAPVLPTAAHAAVPDVLEIAEEVIPKPPPVAAAPPAAPPRDFAEVPTLFQASAKPAPEPPPVLRTPKPEQTSANDFSASAVEWLAERWMAWVGAAALLLGFGFFVKYAIERGWIGPEIRVGLGLIFAAALYVLGAVLLRRDYRPVGQGVVGSSLGFWYLSLYAGHHWYGFFPETFMFAAMAIGAFALLALAVAFHAQPVAILGVLGGFLAPLLMSTSTPSPWPLFRYILVVDAAALAAASFRRWRVTEIVSFAATALLWSAWFERTYTTPYLSDVVWLLSLFFVLFVGAQVWNFLVKNHGLDPADLLLVFSVPTLFGFAVYCVTYNLYRDWHGSMAAGLAAVYAALSIVGRRVRAEQQLLADCFMGIALSFLAAAIPLQFTGHWIPIVGAVYAAALVTVGLRREVAPLRAGGFFVLGAVQLLLLSYVLATLENPERITPWALQRAGWVDAPIVSGPWSFINGRSLAMLANVVALGWIAREYRRHPGAIFEWEAGSRDWAVLGAALGMAGTAILETFAYVGSRHWPWDTFSYLACVEVALLVAGLATLAARIGPRWLFDFARAAAFALFIGLVIGFIVIGTGERRVDALTQHPLWGNAVFFNPRGFAFLTTLIVTLYVFGLARRHPDFTSEAERKAGWTPASQFAFLALLSGWLMIATETFAYAQVHKWSATQLLAFSTVHVAALVAAAITMTARIGPPSSSAIAVMTSIVLGVMCLGLAAQVFDGHTWRQQANGRLWLTAAVFNPRGLAFLCAAGSLVWFARLTRGMPGTKDDHPLGQTSLYQFAALMAHLVIWLALTVEVWAAGLAGDWGTGKSLGVTLAWTVWGLVLFGVGLAWRWTSVRLASLAVFAATAGKAFLFDVWDLAPVIRYVAFIGLGVALLSTSYFYHRFRDRLRDFIANPDAKL